MTTKSFLDLRWKVFSISKFGNLYYENEDAVYAGDLTRIDAGKERGRIIAPAACPAQLSACRVCRPGGCPGRTTSGDRCTTRAGNPDNCGKGESI